MSTVSSRTITDSFFWIRFPIRFVWWTIHRSTRKSDWNKVELNIFVFYKLLRTLLQSYVPTYSSPWWLFVVEIYKFPLSINWYHCIVIILFLYLQFLTLTNTIKYFLKVNRCFKIHFKKLKFHCIFLKIRILLCTLSDAIFQSLFWKNYGPLRKQHK